jgi:hypothetical protein
MAVVSYRLIVIDGLLTLPSMCVTVLMYFFFFFVRADQAGRLGSDRIALVSRAIALAVDAARFLSDKSGLWCVPIRRLLSCSSPPPRTQLSAAGGRGRPRQPACRRAPAAGHAAAARGRRRPVRAAGRCAEFGPCATGGGRSRVRQARRGSASGWTSAGSRYW